MPPSHEQSAELSRALGLVAGGDKSALRLLYDRLSPTVMAVAFRLLRRREEAEEIVQETFTTVWRLASSYDESRGSVGAWITTIARHRALDRLRSRRDTRSLDSVVEQVVDSAPLPQDLVSNTEDGVRVRRALESLPAEQRSVVLLAYFHGLSQTEIAERTGEPLGTVKTRVRLAIRRLGGMLREEAVP